MLAVELVEVVDVVEVVDSVEAVFKIKTITLFCCLPPLRRRRRRRLLRGFLRFFFFRLFFFFFLFFLLFFFFFFFFFPFDLFLFFCLFFTLLLVLLLLLLVFFFLHVEHFGFFVTVVGVYLIRFLFWEVLLAPEFDARLWKNANALGTANGNGSAFGPFGLPIGFAKLFGSALASAFAFTSNLSDMLT